MSSRRLHMSDVENEKSEGLAYTKVFKGKHTFQNAHQSNPPGGLTHTRWPYCHRAIPLDFAHRADAQSGNNNNNNNNFRVSNIRVSYRTLIYNVCPEAALT